MEITRRKTTVATTAHLYITCDVSGVDEVGSGPLMIVPADLTLNLHLLNDTLQSWDAAVAGPVIGSLRGSRKSHTFSSDQRLPRPPQWLGDLIEDLTNEYLDGPLTPGQTKEN